ncbi:probable serine/threonine-protein kinase DDB_G0281745 isoform X9 [Agelaius tricolor]|uniref:probable serine/threonine-protein kinase DDB_G0281745 isoform X9 n=1 Tax=Agelaius tricolor TaxID=9191 RepID=UPI0039F1B63B
MNSPIPRLSAAPRPPAGNMQDPGKDLPAHTAPRAAPPAPPRPPGRPARQRGAPAAPPPPARPRQRPQEEEDEKEEEHEEQDESRRGRGRNHQKTYASFHHKPPRHSQADPQLFSNAAGWKWYPTVDLLMLNYTKSTGPSAASCVTQRQ